MHSSMSTHVRPSRARLYPLKHRQKAVLLNVILQIWEQLWSVGQDPIEEKNDYTLKGLLNLKKPQRTRCKRLYYTVISCLFVV